MTVRGSWRGSQGPGLADPVSHANEVGLYLQCSTTER